MKCGKACVGVIAVMALWGVLAYGASASRLSLSSQTFRAGFARVDLAGGFTTVECAMTLEGSLHSRTFAKSVLSLVGLITRAVLGVCSRGTATILPGTMPWHLRYRGFRGTLPAVTALRFEALGYSYQIRESWGVTCLASGEGISMETAQDPAGTLLSMILSGILPTNCGFSGTLNGTTNSFTVSGSVTRITMTLI